MTSMTIIQHWNPEDRKFWDLSGRAVARRNLWVSVPALALAFAVWMLWSVVVVHLPAAGFRYSTNQLFWLTALPALCGATLRIFYAFAVPMIGGRRFTTLATRLSSGWSDWLCCVAWAAATSPARWPTSASSSRVPAKVMRWA